MGVNNSNPADQLHCSDRLINRTQQLLMRSVLQSNLNLQVVHYSDKQLVLLKTLHLSQQHLEFSANNNNLLSQAYLAKINRHKQQEVYLAKVNSNSSQPNNYPYSEIINSSNNRTHLFSDNNNNNNQVCFSNNKCHNNNNKYYLTIKPLTHKMVKMRFKES